LREYIYKENEIELIRHLRNNTPKKIWYNFMFYVFDYGNYHLTLECVDKQAKSQNKSDEAIVAELTRKNERYIHDEHSKLICENKPIDNIYIVRTFLYFSDFRNFSKPEKIANRINGLLLEIENKYLKAFLQSNGFGFHIWKDKYFYETDALKKDNELYEFIKIEE
jgi:hypothetical protein